MKGENKSIEIEKLRAKNEILEKQIEYTKSVIDQQNAQISKMSGHFQIFWGITALILVTIGFVVSVQFIKPAKELQKESREILDNLKNGMKKVFEEKYEEIEKEKFDSAIKILKFGDFRSKSNAINIIRDYNIRGFVNDEISKIIEYLNYSEVNDDPSNGINMYYLELVTVLSQQQSNKTLDIFFSRFLKDHNRLGLSDAVYYYINNNSLNYKNELLEVFRMKDENGYTFYLTYFFITIEDATKTNAKNIEILNDKDFVDELENLGLLNELLDTYNRYKEKGVTKTKTVQDQWPILKRQSYLKKRVDNLLK